jgi:hypothetical protein
MCSVTEEVPTVTIKDKIYRTKIGEATSAYRFRCFGHDSTSYEAGGGDDTASRSDTNYIRGMFSPYLAVYCSGDVLRTGHVYNIYKDS